MQFYARDIMSNRVITARPEMTCEEAAELLTYNKITGAPVVNPQGILVGVITIQDVLQAEMNLPYNTPDYFSQTLLEQELGESGFHLEPTTGLVSDAMTQKVFTCYPDTPIEELATLMYENRIHRIIVINRNEQRPIGVVSTFDLLKLLAEMPSTAHIAP